MRNPVTIKLRTASLDELDSVYTIRRAAILGISTEIDPSVRQAWADERAPQFYAERLAAGNVILASAEGDDIGWASHSDARITGLYVRPAWGHIGVGRALMARVEAEVRKRGYEYVKLEASPNALPFYTKLGYTPVGPPDDDGAVPMEKRLLAAQE